MMVKDWLAGQFGEKSPIQATAPIERRGVRILSLCNHQPTNPSRAGSYRGGSANNRVEGPVPSRAQIAPTTRDTTGSTVLMLYSSLQP